MGKRVTVWNEYRHERESDTVADVYPDGIHAVIAETLSAAGHDVETATLDEGPQHGLTEDVLEATDVLTWWGHAAHDEVNDEVVERVKEHVLDGMGLLVLHSGHLSKIFRALMGMKLWRERLDRTTNWAVIVMAAIITWAFSSANNPHYILLIGVATLSVFLVIEARRYRGYEIWRTRVRILQENVWAYGLDPSAGVVDPDWREKLSQDYRTPTLKISAEEAVAHRLRRVYLPLFGILLAAWLVRITAFSPEPWIASAAIGMIPGTVVVAVVALFYLGAVALACRPRTWHAKGELRAENLRKRQE